jgi:hypothetical protein
MIVTPSPAKCRCLSGSSPHRTRAARVINRMAIMAQSHVEGRSTYRETYDDLEPHYSAYRLRSHFAKRDRTGSRSRHLKHQKHACGQAMSSIRIFAHQLRRSRLRLVRAKGVRSTVWFWPSLAGLLSSTRRMQEADRRRQPSYLRSQPRVSTVQSTSDRYRSILDRQPAKDRLFLLWFTVTERFRIVRPSESPRRPTGKECNGRRRASATGPTIR